MPTTEEDKGFEARVRMRLRDDVSGLDGATLSRLNRARHAALAEAERPAWLAASRWAPAGGAVAAALVVALLLRQGPLPAEVPAQASAEDIEILLGDEDLELFEELEFYAWLEMQSEVG